VSGALAHDLRSPVARLTAAIDTALGAVEAGGAGAAGESAPIANPANARAVDALLAARADAEGLNRMLENALEIARLEGGAIQDRRVAQDL
ncbi:hypothetical protein ABTM45_19120, partial [Acinetobacter baumannii]